MIIHLTNQISAIITCSLAMGVMLGWHTAWVFAVSYRIS